MSKKVKRNETGCLLKWDTSRYRYLFHNKNTEHTSKKWRKIRLRIFCDPPMTDSIILLRGMFSIKDKIQPCLCPVKYSIYELRQLLETCSCREGLIK